MAPCFYTRVIENEFLPSILVNGWKAFQNPDSENPRWEDIYHKAACIGFIVGVCDATSQYFNIRSGVAPEGALNAVGKYLDADTERWHEAAVILVVDALSEAFPAFPRKGKKTAFNCEEEGTPCVKH
jgi:hypothetical protein